MRDSSAWLQDPPVEGLMLPSLMEALGTERALGNAHWPALYQLIPSLVSTWYQPLCYTSCSSPSQALHFQGKVTFLHFQQGSSAAPRRQGMEEKGRENEQARMNATKQSKALLSVSHHIQAWLEVKLHLEGGKAPSLGTIQRLSHNFNFKLCWRWCLVWFGFGFFSFFVWIQFNFPGSCVKMRKPDLWLWSQPGAWFLQIQSTLFSSIAALNKSLRKGC